MLLLKSLNHYCQSFYWNNGYVCWTVSLLIVFSYLSRFKGHINGEYGLIQYMMLKFVLWQIWYSDFICMLSAQLDLILFCNTRICMQVSITFSRFFVTLAFYRPIKSGMCYSLKVWFLFMQMTFCVQKALLQKPYASFNCFSRTKCVLWQTFILPTKHIGSVHFFHVFYHKH